MPNRYFNWKLAAVLVMGVAVLGVTAFGLRQWHRSRRAEAGLGAGTKAYDQHKWKEAAKELGRYLAIAQNDVAVLLKYADAQLKIRPLLPNNVRQAIATYRRVLRIEPANSQAAVRLAAMYLAMAEPSEAELITRRCLQAGQPADETQPAAQSADDIELRRILALAMSRQHKFEQAAVLLKKLLAEHPQQILAYETLGMLTEQSPQEFAEPPAHWFDQAVKNNPSSALAYLIRAAFHCRNEDVPEALLDLQQAETLDLSDPDVRLRLAKEFINLNILDKAEKHLNAVQAELPVSQLLWQAWFELAIKSQSKEKMLTVAETGLNVLSAQPWDFLPAAAELLIHCGRYDRAQDCIKQLQQEDVNPAGTAYLQALAADRQGRLFEAAKCWRRAIVLGYESEPVRLALASTLSRLGDQQSAMQQLRTLVSQNPDSLKSRLALARLAAQSGNWTEVAEHARNARRLAPDNREADLLALKARMQLQATQPRQEDRQNWRDLDKKLAQLEKDTGGALEVRLVRFQLALQQGDITTAEMMVKQLKEDHPAHVKVRLAEAELLAAQQSNDQAISVLKDTVSQLPCEPEPIRYLAILLARQGRQEQCQTVINDALAQINEPAAQRRLSLLLADFYQRWDQHEKAYEFLNSLVNSRPGQVPIMRRLLRCRQVEENPQKAQQLVDDIKLLEGEDGWQWRYEQAKIWFAQGNFEENYPKIVSLLEKNLLANPNDQHSRVLLAAAYERSGELQLALSTYRDALNRAPDDLRVIIPTVTAFYKAREHEQAQEILNRAADQKLYHPELRKLQLQNYLSSGQWDSATKILETLLDKDEQNAPVCLSLALLKMRRGSFGQAEELLTKLKDQKPDWLPATVAQIELYVRQNKSTEALTLCDQMVKGSGNAAAYILRGKTHRMLGQNDKAEEDFERATVIESDSLPAWIAKSDFHRLAGDFDLAVECAQKAILLAPDNPNVQRRAVSLLLRSQKPDLLRQAKTILDGALQSNPTDIDLLLLRAHALVTERTAPAIEEAQRILQDMTEQYPKTDRAWALLGEIALAGGDIAKALDITLNGLGYLPDNKTLLLLKAQCEAKHSVTLAVPTLEALYEMDPSDTDVAVLLAETYAAAGQSEKAVKMLRAQVSLCRPSTRRKCTIALASALYRNGDAKEAAELFEALCRDAPDDPAPMLAQVRLLKHDNLWDQIADRVTSWCRNHLQNSRALVTVAAGLAAIQSTEAERAAEDVLRMLIADDSGCTRAISALAMLLQMTGRSVEAGELYQRVLELEPDNAIAINNRAWILCEDQNKPNEALELAQSGLQKQPDYIDLIDTRGVAYYRLGQFQKALQDFRRCLRLYPEGTPALTASYFHLGRALVSVGQNSEAIDSLRKALELDVKVGGLSAEDTSEAQHLVEQLSSGGPYVSVITSRKQE